MVAADVAGQGHAGGRGLHGSRRSLPVRVAEPISGIIGVMPYEVRSSVGNRYETQGTMAPGLNSSSDALSACSSM